jgi:hypothetical protein
LRFALNSNKRFDENLQVLERHYLGDPEAVAAAAEAVARQAGGK